MSEINGVSISEVTIGGMSPEHAEAIIAMARAAEANAKAIEAIASNARVEFETGIHFGDKP